MASNAIDISAALSKQDASEIMRQMKRGSRELNRSMGKSVKFAAWSVADALRTATAISKKRRPVEKDADAAAREKLRDSSGRFLTLAERAPTTWKVKAFRKGKRKIYKIKAKNKTEAKKHPVAQVSNYGLAQKAWHWAQGRLGSRRGGKKVGSRAMTIAKNNVTTTVNLKGNNPMVRIDNRLPYATAAFKGSGEQVMANVMARAGRRMAKIIDGQIAKKMGAK